MSTITELAELHHLIGSLRRCVTSFQSKYGDSTPTRRIVNDTARILNDVELLEIDAGELDLGQHTVVVSAEKIGIPDTPYDSAFWRDVDDEGVGGHNRR